MQLSFDLQNLCEHGQELLSQTNYLAAEHVLMQAERIAWESHNWETLARLYMPLQESRRQKRQLCGEGKIRLDLWGEELNIETDCAIPGRAGPSLARATAEQIATLYPQGQLLIAGDATLAPAIELRRLAAERNLYLETFLAASYRLGQQRAIVIVGLEESRLPSADQIATIDQLLHQIPPHSLVLTDSELTAPDKQTYAHTMSLWERLHLPYLAAADSEADPIRKMAAYRQIIQVDYACELAHQKLADVAAGLGRTASSHGM